MNSPLVKEKIASFLAWNRNPKTSKDVRMFVFKKSGIRVPVHLVLRYPKEDLQQSYTLGKSRPAWYDWNKNMLQKSYFIVKMIQIFPWIDAIVNIDKAWFSRTRVAKRSWLRRRMDKTITNIKHFGSISLISAITSTG